MVIMRNLNFTKSISLYFVIKQIKETPKKFRISSLTFENPIEGCILDIEKLMNNNYSCLHYKNGLITFRNITQPNKFVEADEIRKIHSAFYKAMKLDYTDHNVYCIPISTLFESYDINPFLPDEVKYNDIIQSTITTPLKTYTIVHHWNNLHVYNKDETINITFQFLDYELIDELQTGKNPSPPFFTTIYHKYIMSNQFEFMNIKKLDRLLIQIYTFDNADMNTDDNNLIISDAILSDVYEKLKDWQIIYYSETFHN